ncbi:MAG TPA: hypothetical protein VK976_01595 [Verrucomicrobiae bacterium]|nr:hypothetical protein [Verrucomicrobiae bacterium]
MDVLWLTVYCLIAVLVLFALTFHSEILDEKKRCDHLVKPAIPSAGKKPDNK